MQLNSRIQHNSVGSGSGFLNQRPPLLQKVPQASKTRNLGADGRGSSTAPPAASARAEPGPCAPRPGWAQPGGEERQRQPEPRGREGSAEGLRGGEGRAGPGRLAAGGDVGAEGSAAAASRASSPRFGAASPAPGPFSLLPFPFPSPPRCGVAPRPPRFVPPAPAAACSPQAPAERGARPGAAPRCVCARLAVF